MAILLIRHGETLGNRHRVVQTPDTPLSEVGLDQAARLAKRLAASPIREIWTSPQPRARATAAALESVSGLTALEQVDLEERSFGDVRGTPYSELGFDLMGPDFDPPNGESWPVFHARVDRIWDAVEQHWAEHYAASPVAGAPATSGAPADSRAPAGSGSGEPAHLAIVSHGLVCRSLLERRLAPGADLTAHRDELGHLFLRNTSLTVIEPRVVPGGDLEVQLPLIGCVAHLESDAPAALGAV